VELVIARRGEAGCSVLAIAGEIDVSSAHQFATALDQLIDGGELRFVVGFSDVRFCGSAESLCWSVPTNDWLWLVVGCESQPLPVRRAGCLN
jgi:hypothetical protein